ncbi:MAG: DUF3054 domain-containing protein [Halobacteriaceae archaeon]
MRGPDWTVIRRFAAGDILAIATFVVVGELSHGIDPVATPLIVLDTALPFLLGWLLVAPLVGAYTRRVLDGPRWLIGLSLTAWVGADVLAQLLRDTAAFHGSGDPIFFVVAAVVGGSLLVGGRLAVTAVTNWEGPGIDRKL